MDRKTIHSHLCSYGFGLTLVLIALGLNIWLVADRKVDTILFLPAALVIVIDCLLAAWFTCSIVKTLRKIPEAGGARR